MPVPVPCVSPLCVMTSTVDGMTLSYTASISSSAVFGSLSKVMPSVFGVTAMSGGVKLSSASGVSSSPGVSLSLPSFSCGKFGMSGSLGSVVTL